MRVSLDAKKPRRGQTDWKALKKLSDEEITRRARSDPDNPPLTDEELAAMRRVPEVKRIRLQLALSQEDFSRIYHVPLSTLRDWEQGRSKPDQTSRTFLQLIERDPERIRALLEETRRSHSVLEASD